MTALPTYSNGAHERRTRPETEETWRTRAQERVRHAIRVGKLTKPTICPECGGGGQICSYSSDPMNAIETVRFLCNRCLRKIQPRKVTAPLRPRFQNIRKLPPYEELKKLVIDDGLTYGEVAEIYSCNKAVVHRTLRDRAIKAGEWPLPIDRAAKRARVNKLRRKLPDYPHLKRLLIDPPQGAGMTYAEVAQRYGVSDSHVHNKFKAMAQARGEWPLPISGAAKIKRAIRLMHESDQSKTIMAVMIHGLLEEHCQDNEITLAQWARQHNFLPQYVYAVRIKLRNDPKARIDKAYAVRVLAALGEDIPPHLQRYVA